VSEARRTRLGAVVAGSVLVLGGLASWALYVQRSDDAPHAFARGGTPPGYVQVEAGRTYRIAVRGGVATEAQAGIDPQSLNCTAARPGEAPGALNLSAENADTKAIDDIASFTSAVTGRLHVECTGLGAVFVANADDAAFDWSGLWLVLASLALVAGTPLVLSLLRDADGRASDGSLADVERIDPAAEEFL
jgi:hypothetical protein